MASLETDKSGNRTIRVLCADLRRRPIRLGKVPLKLATSIKLQVAELEAIRAAALPLPVALAKWTAAIDDDLHGKLVAVGLVDPREKSAVTLASFVDEFISKRAISTKASTRAVYGRVRKHLVEHFGPKKRLDDITAGDADDWVRYLQREKLAENTIRRHTGVAKQFFNDAIRRKLLTENPFKGLKQSVLANESRFHFVTVDDAERVIDACPNTTWRLIVALARYGGLRTPSETFALKWCDVDWERQRMTVSSPKTEHHHGGDKRVVPIFPRLKPHLEAAFDAAEPGSVFVIPPMGDGRKNLRTRFERIIGRAGLTPWPKLFQNLRSTCETELCENFPLHVVTKWLGNSEQIAKKHYLQVTDEHFERATLP